MRPDKQTLELFPVEVDPSAGDTGSITKSELIARLAGKYPQLAARDAEFAVRALIDTLTQSLVEGRRIEIRGFGSFSLTRRPPRVGRNPKSGEAVQVPEKRAPHFKPGKELRVRVDQAAAEAARSAARIVHPDTAAEAHEGSPPVTS